MKTLVLKCRSQEDLDDWTGAIKAAISNSTSMMENDGNPISFGQANKDLGQAESSCPTEPTVHKHPREEFELIVTDHEVSSASSIGTITLSPKDYLSVVRRSIQKQLDPGDLPAVYSFLRRVCCNC